MNDYYFPHSTVEEFSTDQRSAIIEVKDVILLDESLVKLKVTVQDFSLLQENKGAGKDTYDVIDELKMQAPTGEILAASWDETSFFALIQWEFFQPHKTLTRSYKVQGKKVVVDVGEPYPDNR